MKPKLDWAPRFDEKSRLFAVSQESDYSNKRVYHTPPRLVLDQGQEGACVGHGWAGAIASAPARTKLPNLQKSAFGFYNLAKFLDEWEGENYDGTSVLAGAKVLNDLGFINGYSWCFNTKDIIRALHEHGPVVIGVPWYEGMYETPSHGTVVIDGDLVGGHCLFIYAYHPRRYNPATNKVEPMFYWRNSWSKSYGRNGSGYITESDLSELIAENAEACVPQWFN